MTTSTKKPRVKKQEEKITPNEISESKDPEQEIGLYVSVKGPIKGESEADYMHPQDLARYELFRVKKELAQAKKVIVEKEEALLRITLKWQEQNLRIAKLEHDLKAKDLLEIKKDLDKTIAGATTDLCLMGSELKDKYNIDPDSLIYDDESGKIMFVEED